MAFGRVGLDTYEFSRLDLLQRDKLANRHPEGFSSYLILPERSGRGFDGMLTNYELRNVRDAQRAAMLDGDSFARNRYEESERLLENMRRDGLDAVNYLPKPLHQLGLDGDGEVVDLRIRMRATEILDAAYLLSRGGEITQGVIDFVADKYEKKWRSHDITRGSLGAVYDEIDRIIDVLTEDNPAMNLHKPMRPD